MRILIVKLGAIGDIIHTIPVLPVIRKRYPEAVISWVVETRSAEILRGNPLIDNLIEVDTRLLRGRKLIEQGLMDGSRQLRRLRQFDFDLAIDFQGLLKSAVISKLSGASQRWGFSRSELREPASRVFYTDVVRLAGQVHVIHRNLSLLGGALDIDPSKQKIEFPIASSDSDKQEADAIVDQLGGDFVLLNPAGGWVTKLWPAANYGRLADILWENLHLRSVITTGPKEERLANEVLNNCRSGKAIAMKPTLKGFYELAKKASVYVGGDTGPTHLAIAAGTPIVGIFGPTEWWRNGSLDPNDICVERLDIDCRVDCHRRTCSKWICMGIRPEVVSEAVKKRIVANVRQETAPASR